MVTSPLLKSGLALLTLGVVLGVWASLAGELAVFLFLVFPVIVARGAVGVLAIATVALGGLLTFVGVGLSQVQAGPDVGRHEPGPGAMQPPEQRPAQRPMQGSGQEPAEPSSKGQQERGRGRTRGGGVVLIGPIPIAWGSDRGMLVWVLVLALVLMAMAVIAMAIVGT